ncbi:hypothetical protein D9X30_3568 [Cupriavidus sp. U2]|nr:hypothetical protein D9X30_3568 [Cupriavidus sp. U2]
MRNRTEPCQSSFLHWLHPLWRVASMLARGVCRDSTGCPGHPGSEPKTDSPKQEA